MTSRPSHRPVARRSDYVQGRRSASSAPSIVHLVLVPLVLLLVFISYLAGQHLAVPLTESLANSWQQEDAQTAAAIPEDSANGLKAFTPEVQRWNQHIEAWAAQSELPPALIATVIQIESCGDPLAQSGAGAMGLFQVMPYHFEPTDNPLNTETNARAGLRYLSRSHQIAEGSIERTLAGYNGGHGVIHRPRAEWPAETQRYADWGSGILADIRADNLPSPTLENWLAAGGAHLCRQAAQRQLAAH